MSYFVSVPDVALRQRLRSELLDVNRAVASWLGLDARLTLSSNIAMKVARRTGMPVTLAKRWFHGGVAGFIGLLFGQLGIAAVATVGLAAVAFAWLESFDSSDELR